MALVRELVDEHLLVSEEEIRRAMVFAAESLRVLVEGGGAVALAAFLGRRLDLGGVRGTESTGVVLSGGHVTLDRLQLLMGRASDP